MLSVEVYTNNIRNLFTASTIEKIDVSTKTKLFNKTDRLVSELKSHMTSSREVSRICNSIINEINDHTDDEIRSLARFIAFHTSESSKGSLDGAYPPIHRLLQFIVEIKGHPRILDSNVTDNSDSNEWMTLSGTDWGHLSTLVRLDLTAIRYFNEYWEKGKQHPPKLLEIENEIKSHLDPESLTALNQTSIHYSQRDKLKSKLLHVFKNTILLKLLMDISNLGDEEINKTIKFFGIENCSKVKILDLFRSDYNFPLTFTNLDFLRNFKNLESININYCDNLYNIEGLSQCEELQKLNLTGCYKVLDFTCLDRCKKLKELNLSKCGIININPIKKCENLEDLNLNYSACDIKGFKSCKNIKSLKLAYCRNINLNDLKEFENIQSLSLSGHNLDNLNFIKFNNKIKELDVSHCSLRNIEALSNCQSLEVINLAHCFSFYFKIDLSILLRLPNLKVCYCSFEDFPFELREALSAKGVELRDYSL